MFEHLGFRLDAGPTVITAPLLIAEPFTLFGERMDNNLELLPVTPWHRFQFAGDDKFGYGRTLGDTLTEIGRTDQGAYWSLLAHSKGIFDTGFTDLSSQPFHRLWTMPAKTPRLQCRCSDRSVRQLVASYVRYSKLCRAFSTQPLLIGDYPSDTMSACSLIYDLERASGVHLATDGTGTITRLLGDLRVGHRFDVGLGETMRQIKFEQSAATDVILEGGRAIAVDLVVSTANAFRRYTAVVQKAGQARATRFALAAAKCLTGLFVPDFGLTRRDHDVTHRTSGAVGAIAKFWRTDPTAKCSRTNSRSIGTGRPRPTRALLRQGATASAYCARFRTCKPEAIGRPKGRACKAGSWRRLGARSCPVWPSL